MSFNSYYKVPLDSSRLTEIRKNKTLYANAIIKNQANTQGCNTVGTGLQNGGVAPGSIIPELIDGARNTTVEERDAILASTSCIQEAAIIPVNYEVITDGLILYYNIGDPACYPGSGVSVYDLSPGGGYTGTLVNGVGYSAANGGSLTFDGTTQYLDTTYSLDYESFTINSWFKCSDVIDYRMLISKEQVGNAPWNYRMFLETGTGVLTGDIAIPGSSVILYGSTTVADGIWHFGTFSRDAATHQVKLYVDGLPVSSDTDTFPGSITTSQSVWIGRSDYQNGMYPFDGNIGDILIYERALTADEVYTNYMATKGRFGL